MSVGHGPAWGSLALPLGLAAPASWGGGAKDGAGLTLARLFPSLVLPLAFSGSMSQRQMGPKAEAVSGVYVAVARHSPGHLSPTARTTGPLEVLDAKGRDEDIDHDIDEDKAGG